LITLAEPVSGLNIRFLLQHPAHFIALGGGSGLVRHAPGTAGTLAAFPLYALSLVYCTPLQQLVLIAGAFVLGIWACARTGDSLGVADPGAIVWDEIVAFMLVLFFTPVGYVWQCAAFVLFRFFDIVKPQPIRYFDRKLKSGFGVMFDDFLAACYTLIVLAIARNVFPG
jgi:phosphatidylglycerophosphatase A